MVSGIVTSSSNKPFRHQVFNLMGGTPFRMLLSAVVIAGASVGTAAVSIFTGVFFTSGDDRAAVMSPNSISALCESYSNNCKASNLMTMAAIGGVLVTPLTAGCILLAAATVEEILRGTADARYRLARKCATSVHSKNGQRFLNTTVVSPIQRFDYVLDNLGYIAIAPLAIWQIPGVIIISVLAAAAGGSVGGVWPQTALKSFVQASAIGGAVFGLALFIFFALACIILSCAKVPLPCKASIPTQVETIQQHPTVQFTFAPVFTESIPCDRSLSNTDWIAVDMCPQAKEDDSKQNTNRFSNPPRYSTVQGCHRRTPSSGGLQQRRSGPLSGSIHKSVEIIDESRDEPDHDQYPDDKKPSAAI